VSTRADAETLRAIPIFAECDPVALQVLAFSSERQFFEPGEPLLKKGYKGVPAYLILSGTVDIVGDGTQSLGQAGPGALLGEISMIGQLPCTISATATSVVTAARISRALFLRVAEEFPEFGRAVFRAVSHKLDDSMRDLVDAQDLLNKARSFTRS
jgi:CRP/FNR family transcriptional regulator, cyclic AMP receptor protein